MEVGPEFVQGSWSEHEAQLSLTWRELKAVVFLGSHVKGPYCEVVYR